MKALVLSNCELEEREIKDGLEALQEIVGGYIEIPFLGNDFNQNKIDIIINDEGKFIEGLNAEIAVVDKESGSVLDIVYGNCIFASHDAEGNTIGLDENQIQFVKKKLTTVVQLTDIKARKAFVARALFI